MTNIKKIKRTARHQRIRAKIKGTEERPRLVVFRSLKNIQVQLINDLESSTLMALSTTAKEIKDKVGYGGNSKAASILGEFCAKAALGKGIKTIVFDRGGYAYHGRIKALAEALRKGGVVF